MKTYFVSLENCNDQCSDFYFTLWTLIICRLMNGPKENDSAISNCPAFNKKNQQKQFKNRAKC